MFFAASSGANLTTIDRLRRNDAIPGGYAGASIGAGVEMVAVVDGGVDASVAATVDGGSLPHAAPTTIAIPSRVHIDSGS